VTDRPYLTTQDLIDLAGKSQDFWARVCKSGALPAVRLGNDWRVERTAFESFMRGDQPGPDRRQYMTARQRRRAR
jgi:hypothetical protein